MSAGCVPGYPPAHGGDIVPRSIATLTPQCVINLSCLASRGANSHNNGMEIVLNGDTVTVDADSTVAALLQAQGLGERRVAVEVNGEIVPRGQHAGHVLAAGDQVEIVHALGGG